MASLIKANGQKKTETWERSLVTDRMRQDFVLASSPKPNGYLQDILYLFIYGWWRDHRTLDVREVQ